LLTTVCVLLSSVTQVGSIAQTTRKPGDKIGHYLHSDIVTYIDGHPIKSYNIDGYTAVIAEDLAKYGFAADWDAKERTLTLQRDFWATPKPTYRIEQSPKNRNGSIAGDIFYTDIKCYHWWGLLPREIVGFNIGGSTAVYVDDLAKVYGDTYVYDDADRTLRLGLVKGWVSDEYSRTVDMISNTLIPIPDMTPGIMADGSCYTFANQTPKYDDAATLFPKTKFVLAEWSNTYSSPLGDVGGFGSYFFTFQQSYSGIEQMGGNPDFFKIIHDNTNIKYGTERIAEDTPERRNALSEVFRVYINDELVGGEMNYQQGNNSFYYQFIFDKCYGLNSIRTIRFELGYR